MNEFIEAFKKSPWYYKLFAKHPVMLIYLTGSRLYDITDERSDYDLNVIWDSDTSEIYPDAFFTWRGKKVHWHWLSPKMYLEEDIERSMLDNVGLMLFRYITDDAIVYQNPDYADTIVSLRNRRDIVSDLGVSKLYQLDRQYIANIMKAGGITEAYYSKQVAYLCLASYIKTNETVDTELIRRIKRIKWEPVEDELKAKAFRRLKILAECFGDVYE